MKKTLCAGMAELGLSHRCCGKKGVLLFSQHVGQHDKASFKIH